MERSGSGVGGGAVNMFVYGPIWTGVEAELRALQADRGREELPGRGADKPEPGMGPIH